MVAKKVDRKIDENNHQRRRILNLDSWSKVCFEYQNDQGQHQEDGLVDRSKNAVNRAGLAELVRPSVEDERPEIKVMMLAEVVTSSVVVAVLVVVAGARTVKVTDASVAVVMERAVAVLAVASS
jgi:hypothetical protein